jgi:hypothetical protein
VSGRIRRPHAAALAEVFAGHLLAAHADLAAHARAARFPSASRISISTPGSARPTEASRWRTSGTSLAAEIR